MVFVIAPSQSDVDEPIRVTVHNLQPKQQVCLVAQVTRMNVTLSSFANYESNEHGLVDLSRDEALAGGTYQGCEPMGLFWSMEVTSDEKIPFKMLSGNELDRWTYEIRVIPGHRKAMDDVLRSLDNPLAQTSINRSFLPFGVRRFNVYYGNMRGLLFLPEGDGKFPAVIDIFGGAQGLVAYRGGLFAKNGFACLCVAYAAYADLPSQLKTLDFDYFNECYDFLTKHPSIDSRNIGVFGSCLGGTIALMLSRCQPGIKAVAAVSPQAFAITYNYHLRLKDDDKEPEEKIVKGVQWRLDLMEHKDGVYDVKPSIGPSMEIAGDWRRYSLDYGRIKVPLLLFYGTDDRFCIVDLVLPLVKEQFEKENKTNAEIVVYPDAGHVIQLPYLPLFAKFFSPSFGCQVWFGGKTVQHARAQENMWLRVLDFFKKNLSSDNELSKL